MMKTIRYTVLIFVMWCVTGAALADAGHDARKEPAAMEGMDHSKMKMDGQGGAAAGHWMAPPGAAAKPNPIPAKKESIARGKNIYLENCASCHGASGRGDGPAGKALKPKPTNLVAMAGGHSDGDYAWKIENGRGPMPAWKNVLTQDQIWDVVNYLQSLGKPKTKAKSPKAGHDAGHAH